LVQKYKAAGDKTTSMGKTHETECRTGSDLPATHATRWSRGPWWNLVKNYLQFSSLAQEVKGEKPD
jgi:hypothetical protein